MQTPTGEAGVLDESVRLRRLGTKACADGVWLGSDVCRIPSVELVSPDLANALDGPPIPGFTTWVAGRRLFAIRPVCLPPCSLGMVPWAALAV